MKIAAVTKLKHGDLYEALEKAGITQSQLARDIGHDSYRISNYVCLKVRPTEEIACKIQIALGKYGVYIDIDKAWPREFKGINKSAKQVVIKEIPLDRLIDETERKQISANESYDVVQTLLIKERKRELLNAMNEALAFKEAECIKLFYGLNEDNEPYTLGEIGRIFRVTRERVRQLINKGCRELIEWLNKKGNEEIKDAIT